MPRFRSWTEEELIQAVADSTSMAQVLRRLDLSITGGNYRNIQNNIIQRGLSTEHWKGQGWNKGQTFPCRQPIEEILVKSNIYKSTHNLKLRLWKEGILEKHCYECGITSWRNKPISLRLDHINGDNCDNRLDNLRILCPNCDSQTDTYCGKNKR